MSLPYFNTLTLIFYRKQQTDFYDVHKLQENMIRDLKRAENLVTKIWYPKLIKMIKKKGALDNMPLEILKRFLKCASTIISCQVNAYLNLNKLN